MVKRRPRKTPLADPIFAAWEQRQRERDPQNWGIALELALPNNTNVDARFDAKGRPRRALRLDVFSLLFYRPGAKLSAQSYDAVRRLQKDMAILHATQGSAEAIRTSCSVAHWLVEDFGLARADAGRRIRAVLDLVPAASSRLLVALCEPAVVSGAHADWHAIVRQHTGERHRIRRAERVRQACDELCEGYKLLDNRPHGAPFSQARVQIWRAG